MLVPSAGVLLLTDERSSGSSSEEDDEVGFKQWVTDDGDEGTASVRVAPQGCWRSLSSLMREEDEEVGGKGGVVDEEVLLA